MKTKLRKALSIILCVFLLIPALASCADSQTPGPTASGKPSVTPTSTGQNGDGASGEAKTPKIFPTPEPLSGELRVALGDNYDGHAAALVAGFMSRYPDVVVTLDYAVGPEEDLTTEEGVAAYCAKYGAFATRMHEELQNGAGADVVDVSDFSIPLYEFSEQGIFYDLYRMMLDDPNFVREDYFENIFEALAYKNVLPAIPATVSMDYVYLNKNVTGKLGIDADGIGAISPMQILEIYGRALDENLVGRKFWLNCTDTGRTDLRNELYSYLDPKEKTADFNSPGFIAYLNASWRVQTEKLVSEQWTVSISGDRKKVLFMSEEYDADALIYHSTYFQLSDMAHMMETTQYSTRAIRLGLGEHGEKGLFSAASLYAIPESSKNKELAWAFIKYCIEESETVRYTVGPGQFSGDRFFDLIPINRNNLKKYVEAAEQRYWGRDVSEGCAALADWMESAEIVAYLGFDLGEFDDILTQFYDEQTINAEECAQQMQARAEEFFAG